MPLVDHVSITTADLDRVTPLLRLLVWNQTRIRRGGYRSALGIAPAMTGGLISR